MVSEMELSGTSVRPHVCVGEVAYEVVKHGGQRHFGPRAGRIAGFEVPGSHDGEGGEDENTGVDRDTYQ